MKVIYEGKPIILSDKLLIGQGGEATVYRWQDRALKIFHDLPRDALAAKFAKLRGFPSGVSTAVLAPSGLITDPAGSAVGYAMRRVDGAVDLRRYAQRNFRQGAVANGAVQTLLSRLAEELRHLHAHGIVAGDLSDTNVLVTDHRDPWIIDADSLQFGGHLCTVAQERFLDPRLYGLDLSATEAFTRGSDWYAFAVIAFCSLLYFHPYGGVHSSFGTLTRRAEARVSALRDDVTIPKAVTSPRALSEAARNWFFAVFERDLRDPPPRALFEQRWTRCVCGFEHARPLCPECASKGVVRAREVIVRSGRCRVTRVFETHGRILATAMQAGLRYLHFDGRQCLREDGQRVLLDFNPAELDRTRFAIAGRSTFVASKGRIVEAIGERPAARLTSEEVAGETVFAANAERAFTVRDGWLLEERSGQRWGTVVDGQTFIKAGERLGYGFWRTGKLTAHFLFSTERPGLKIIDLPPLQGRILELDVVFDLEHALISILTEAGAKRWSQVHLVRQGGERLASLDGAPESSPLLATATGKTIARGHVVVATDRGLASVHVDRSTRTLIAGDLFADTEPFVAQGAQLLPGPGGSLYLVGPQRIDELRWE